MEIQAVQEESVQADYDERRPSQNLLMLLRSQLRMVYGLWRLHRLVSSLVPVLSYRMHAARVVSAADGRRINDDFNGTLYIAWALKGHQSVRRELFISAEDKDFPLVCRGGTFS